MAKSVLNGYFVPVPCNRIVTGLHKLPASTADRLPSIEDLPDAQQLQNASPSKLSRQQKNEDHESSDEDHEEDRPSSPPEALASPEAIASAGALGSGSYRLPQSGQGVPSVHAEEDGEASGEEEQQQQPETVGPVNPKHRINSTS